ncbi:chromosome partitioning protein, ParB family [Sphingobium sp. AP50]|uniref:ParB/RepB/Spo0J family partition protein n=1 Tax=Sphingobium sp. AP50 TaxID=1884369 RepID=UPI0008B61F5E|nr:ParB N-terminal domain-containing protein [Sphingobium sp. AP50]SEK02119.1 chromosome partitioning protein, ParB family [Sphingobium sp. AP50]
MKLDFLPADKLVASRINMRHATAPDVSDILPSIRKRGVIQSILVRAVPDTDLFEVVAGNRRRHAAQIVMDERRAALEAGAGEGEPFMVPAAILETSDDADALEASMLENFARLAPDEVSQWEAFVRLVKEGQTPDEIGATFAIPELRVKRILALGNLMPRIRSLYRREEIDASTVRHLTLASKSQQREWLKLLDDPDSHAPVGGNLKSWLLGGQSVMVKNALFDLATYKGQIVADLFGEEGYFADARQFWAAQDAAIAARKEAYLEEGWQDVIIMDRGAYFHSWEYRRTPKRKGGRVYIEVRANGETNCHEGYLTMREAEKAAKGEAAAAGIKPVRAELTSTLTAYIDLHRHAAARAALLSQPQMALRMMIAHAIAGSPVWSLRMQPMSTRNEATDESLRLSPGEFLFGARRREMLDLLAIGEDETVLLDSFSGIAPLFHRLMALPDEDIMRLVAIVMGETLSAGSGAVELLGLSLGIDMADWWEADEAFLEPIRDRQVLLELVEEVAGKLVADANRQEKTKVLKQIIRDYLAGTDGRVRTERWVPRWMRFPPAAYTDRGGVATVIAHAHAVKQDKMCEPDAQEQAADMDGQMTAGTGDEPHGEDSEVCEPEDAQRLAA